jgi:hypothetical protein
MSLNNSRQQAVKQQTTSNSKRKRQVKPKPKKEFDHKKQNEYLPDYLTVNQPLNELFNSTKIESNDSYLDKAFSTTTGFIVTLDQGGCHSLDSFFNQPIIKKSSPIIKKSPQIKKPKVAELRLDGLYSFYGNEKLLREIFSYDFSAPTSPPSLPVHLVHGASGTGKTSALKLALEQANYHLIYFPGDFPKGVQSVQSEIDRWIFSRALDGKQYALVFDNFDSLVAEKNNQQNSTEALCLYLETLPRQGQIGPIVFICNDLFSSRSLAPLRTTVTHHWHFYPLSSQCLLTLLQRHCRQRKLIIPLDLLTHISATCDGSASKALAMLQFLSIGPITGQRPIASEGSLGRDNSFQQCNTLFSSDVCFAHRQRAYEENPEIGLATAFENYLLLPTQRPNDPTRKNLIEIFQVTDLLGQEQWHCETSREIATVYFLLGIASVKRSTHLLTRARLLYYSKRPRLSYPRGRIETLSEYTSNRFGFEKKI